MIESVPLLFEKKYHLLRDELQKETYDRFSQKWLLDEYYKLNTELFQISKDEIINTVRDYDGLKFLTHEKIIFLINPNLSGLDASIKELTENSVQISVSPDLFLYIDLSSPYSYFLYDNVGDMDSRIELQDENALWFESCTFLKTIHNQHDILSFSENSQKLTYSFFSSSSEDMYRKWSMVSYYSFIWILYHELGHFLCGHTGFFKAGIEKEYKFEELYGVKKGYLFDISTKWTSELMADCYADFRFSYHLLITNKHFLPPSADNFLSLLTLIPISVFNLYSLFISKDDASKLTEYPSVEARVFNHFCSIYFVWFPCYHQYWDARINKIGIGFKTKYPIEKADLLSYFIHLVFVNNYIGDGRLRITPFWFPLNDVLDIQIFSGTILGMHLALIHEHLEYSENFILKQTLKFYQFFMIDLCTKINMYFGANLKKNWFPEVNYEIIDKDIDNNWLEGLARAMPDMKKQDLKEMIIKRMSLMPLINDPAYKVLDDWMSAICFSVETLYKQDDNSEFMTELRKGYLDHEGMTALSRFVADYFLDHYPELYA